MLKHKYGKTINKIAATRRQQQCNGHLPAHRLYEANARGAKHLWQQRLGVQRRNLDFTAATSTLSYQYYLNQKYYELSDHRGNVNTTISDFRIGVGSVTNPKVLSHYTAVIRSTADYGVWGDELVGRGERSKDFRYGFNGQEKTDEISSGHYTALYWEYDSRIGRRWNLDPVVKPWISGYSVLSNSPIWKIDPNGDDDYFNSQGQLVKRDNLGSKIFVETDKGVVALSKLNSFEGHNAKTIANIAAHYASGLGITGIVGVDRYKNNSEALAYAQGRDKIYLAAGGGRVSDQLDNYNNLKNVLVHEHEHEKQAIRREGASYYNHYSVYFDQVAHSTFNDVDEGFKIGTTGSAVNHLLNAYHQDKPDDYSKGFFEQDLQNLNAQLSKQNLSVQVAEDKLSFKIYQSEKGKTNVYQSKYKKLDSPSE